MFGNYPELADDSYGTIGLDGPASLAGANAEDPLLIEDENGFIESLFTEDGNQGFMLNTTIGGSWFTVPSASNGLPDASLKVLVMQLTTSGALSGQMNYQVFPLGVGLEDVRVTIAFDGAGTFGLGDEQGNACGCTDDEAVNFDPDAVYDDGSCDYDVFGCTDMEACNYNPEATLDDGSCLVEDECGVCGGGAFLQEHVTVMATSWTNAAFVVGPVRFTSAGAKTFRTGIVTVKATCSTSVVNALKKDKVEIVMAAPTRWRATTMWMPCWTTALAITAAVLAKRKRLCHSHCMWRRRLRCCQA